MAINELPFHHYVDADGDSVALPCTDRLINTHASALLRDYGINAVMAHKGEALVRLAGLEAINGDGLAAPGGTGRKSPSDTRFALRSKPDGDDKVAVDWTPAQRKAGTVSVTSAPQRLSDGEAPAEAAEAATDAAVEVDAEPTSAETASAQTASPDAGGSEDTSELDALLASLGGDSPPAEAGTAAGEEPEMDPDLAALLKSLG
jgi:type VI secretion system protein ImpC